MAQHYRGVARTVNQKLTSEQLGSYNRCQTMRKGLGLRLVVSLDVFKVVFMIYICLIFCPARLKVIHWTCKFSEE